MKKYYLALATFIMAFLSSGCNYNEPTITKYNVIVEHNKYYDSEDESDCFGVLYFRDIDDTIIRVNMYDGKVYDYMEIGDTFAIEMRRSSFDKEYTRHNMMFPEEVVVDPGDALRKKNAKLKNDTLVQARRKLLQAQLDANPLQIVASKGVNIRK